MKTDIKILKIALIATTAIIAPAATMMIQYQLREDEEHEFEGDFELASTEEATTPISAIETKGITAPVVAPKPKVNKPGPWRTFRTMEACKRKFRVCKKVRREKGTNKP